MLGHVCEMILKTCQFPYYRVLTACSCNLLVPEIGEAVKAKSSKFGLRFLSLINPKNVLSA